MAEFAICTPAILLLLFWSVYFSDVMMVRIKVLEASRTAAWESTVMRPSGAIKSDLEARFRNLHAQNRDANDPGDYIGIKDVNVAVTVADNEDVNIIGTADWSGVPGGVQRFMKTVDKGLDKIVGYMKLNPKGMNQSDVSITVSNQIIPGNFEMFGVALGDNRLTSPFEFKDTHYLVWDTWKAWPSTYSSVNTNTQTAPTKTYPVAEAMVAEQLDNIAFFGLNKISIFSKLDTLVAKGGMPWFFSDTSAQAADGPVAMYPAAKINKSWVPGNGKKPYRIGNKACDDYCKAGTAFDNPTPGVDRARPTIPFKTASGHWNDGGMRKIEYFSVSGDGGYGIKEINKPENDYFYTYGCRGHYYEGMIKDDGKYGDASSWDGCGGAVGGFFGGGGFGGLSLPSLPSFPTGGP